MAAEAAALLRESPASRTPCSRAVVVRQAHGLRESPASRTPCSRAVVVRQAHGPVNSGQDGVTIDKEG